MSCSDGNLGIFHDFTERNIERIGLRGERKEEYRAEEGGRTVSHSLNPLPVFWVLFRFFA